MFRLIVAMREENNLDIHSGLREVLDELVFHRGIEEPFESVGRVLERWQGTITRMEETHATAKARYGAYLTGIKRAGELLGLTGGY
jgi:hypothetical protein